MTCRFGGRAAGDRSGLKYRAGAYRQAVGGECPVVVDLNTPSCGGRHRLCQSQRRQPSFEAETGCAQSCHTQLRPSSRRARICPASRKTLQPSRSRSHAFNRIGPAGNRVGCTDIRRCVRPGRWGPTCDLDQAGLHGDCRSEHRRHRIDEASWASRGLSRERIRRSWSSRLHPALSVSTRWSSNGGFNGAIHNGTLSSSRNFKWKFAVRAADSFGSAKSQRITKVGSSVGQLG